MIVNILHQGANE